MSDATPPLSELDLSGLTPEEIEELIVLACRERDRRAALEGIPEQISSLAEEYRKGGGDDSTLAQAIAPKEVGQEPL